MITQLRIKGATGESVDRKGQNMDHCGKEASCSYNMVRSKQSNFHALIIGTVRC